MKRGIPKSLFESMALDGIDAGETDVRQHMESELVASNVPAKVNTAMSSLAPGTLATLSSMLSGTNFGKKATEMVSSPVFLKSYSDDLGLPKKGETREQFIERGKSLLRQKLKKSLGG